MRKEKLSLEHRDGDWESNCKRTILTNKQQYSPFDQPKTGLKN